MRRDKKPTVQILSSIDWTCQNMAATPCRAAEISATNATVAFLSARVTCRDVFTMGLGK